MTGFSPPVNRISARQVTIQHRGNLHTVDIATTPDEMEELAFVDQEIFEGDLFVTAEELWEIVQHGYVLALRSPTGGVIGGAQVLLQSTEHIELLDGEAYCYGSGVHDDHRAGGYGRVLHKAQEVLARAAGKRSIWLTVRPTNTASIGSRFRGGFEIVGYDQSVHGDLDAGGGRFLMAKSLDVDGFGADRLDLEHRLQAGDVALLEPADVGSSSELGVAVEIAVRWRDTSDLRMSEPEQRAQLSHLDRTLLLGTEPLFDAGYRGLALIDAPDPGRALLFGRDEPVRRSRPRSGEPPAIRDEWSPLQVVGMNHTSFCSQLGPTDAINAVAAKNVGNVDPIAAADEHQAFVDTLRAEGINVVRSGAKTSKGRFGVFSRDPTFVVGDRAFLAHMQRRARRTEPARARRLFREEDIVDLRGRHLGFIEGGDVLVIDGGHVAVGIGDRTSSAGADALEAALAGTAIEVLRVEHADLHLDVLFTIVGRGLALADRSALPAEFLDRIEQLGFTIIEADPAEQQTLGCNVLAISDRRVIAAAQNTETNARLEAAGVEVISVDIPNLLKRGGGPRCLTCPIRRS